MKITQNYKTLNVIVCFYLIVIETLSIFKNWIHFGLFEFVTLVYLFL